MRILVFAMLFVSCAVAPERPTTLRPVAMEASVGAAAPVPSATVSNRPIPFYGEQPRIAGQPIVGLRRVADGGVQLRQAGVVDEPLLRGQGLGQVVDPRHVVRRVLLVVAQPYLPTMISRTGLATRPALLLPGDSTSSCR